MIGSARLVPYAGLVLSAAFAAVVATPAPTAARLPLALAFACLGPGAALVGHARITDPAVRWAMVLLLSLAVTVGAACGAVWLDAWHPVSATLAVAALTAVSCLVALVRRRGRAAFTPSPAPAPDRPARRRLALADAAVLAAALALWALALARTDVADVADVGQYGLLASIHPAYFAALLLCCAGFLTEVVRGARRGGALLAYVVLLILLLHATVPLLLTEPEYAWTYKHVGVVALFQQYGQVVDAGDIYQSWPGVFAAAAQLADLSGAEPLALARFTPVLLNLAGALVLLAIARTLTADRRVAALTVFLFLCVNWIEEDYLSPQGLAYLFSLGVLLVVLRWLRHLPDDDRARAGGRWRAAGAWLRAGVPPATRISPAGRAAAVGALVLLDTALTVTHQLSPYLAAAQVLALVALGLARPRWIALIVVAIPVLFLLPRFGVVSGSFDILESLNIFGNAGGNADGWGSQGQAFSAIVVRALALGVWIGAALVVIRAARRREAGSVLVPAVAALAPFLLLAAQSYGGEAIYRVFLFSAPWCAFLLAGAAVRTASRLAARRPPGHLRSPGRWKASGRRRAVVAAGALGLSMLALATVQGRHGQLMVDRQSRAEVAAAQYLYEHAEPGAVIALATPNFPSRITARYGEYNRSVPVGEPDLVKGAGLRHVWLNDAYLPQIEQFLSSFDGTATYLVISDGMRRYAKYFGYLPDGSLDALNQTLAASPDWSVSYRTTDVTIFRMAGHAP
jgi:hypothetical protein